MKDTLWLPSVSPSEFQSQGHKASWHQRLRAQVLLGRRRKGGRKVVGKGRGQGGAEDRREVGLGHTD